LTNLLQTDHNEVNRLAIRGGQADQPGQRQIGLFAPRVEGRHAGAQLVTGGVGALVVLQLVLYPGLLRCAAAADGAGGECAEEGWGLEDVLESVPLRVGEGTRETRKHVADALNKTHTRARTKNTAGTGEEGPKRKKKNGREVTASAI